jgi:hypothetical protein
MINLKKWPLVIIMAAFLMPTAALAQRFGGGPTGPDFPSDDPVLKAIWAWRTLRFTTCRNTSQM